MDFVPSDIDQNVEMCDSIAFIDPRNRCLGTRIVAPKGTVDVKQVESTFDPDAKLYTAIRILYGIPEVTI